MAKKRDNLLRDAIADAKMVRETALANAKLALEEAFTPHLTSMLATKLKNEADEDEEEEMNLDLEGADPAAEDGYGSSSGGETDSDASEQSTFKEAADVKNDASGLKSSNIGDSDPSHEYGESSSKDPAAPSAHQHKTANEPLHTVNEDEEVPEADDVEDVGAVAPGAPSDLDAGEEEGGDVADLDLEAVIKELEADIVGDEPEEDGDELPPVAEDDDLDTDDRELAGMEDEPVMEGNEDPSVEDGTGAGSGGETDKDANTKSTFKESRRAVREGPEDNFGGKKAPPFGSEDAEDMGEAAPEDEEEIDLAEVLKEIEDEEKEGELESEVKQVKAELKEYRRAVGFLRSKLNEVNLLNAKLLYTNRLFRDYNMDVRAKMRVVENFDRATTVREAKLVYATIAEAFRGKGSVSKKVRNSITEGLASRRVGSTASLSGRRADGDDVPTVLREGVDLAARFKRLAGIKE